MNRELHQRFFPSLIDFVLQMLLAWSYASASSNLILNANANCNMNRNKYFSCSQWLWTSIEAAKVLYAVAITCHYQHHPPSQTEALWWRWSMSSSSSSCTHTHTCNGCQISCQGRHGSSVWLANNAWTGGVSSMVLPKAMIPIRALAHNGGKGGKDKSELGTSRQCLLTCLVHG